MEKPYIKADGRLPGLGIEMMEWSMLGGKIFNEVHYDKLTAAPLGN